MRLSRRHMDVNMHAITTSATKNEHRARERGEESNYQQE